jgi:hypothetical protein
MIERALLPVQRNRTLNARSVMGGGLCGAARREVGDYWSADVRATTAAVFKQEQRDLVEARQIGAVDDRAALPLSLHQARVCEHGQVGRHGVLWNFHEARQLTSWHTVRFTADQQPECVEPGCLCERRKSGDGF